MGDGTVRFISNNLDINVFRILARTQDGIPVGDF